jgi:hypothetical protein
MFSINSTTALWKSMLLKMFTYQNPFAISCIKLIQDVVKMHFTYVRPVCLLWSESVGCKIAPNRQQQQHCISSLAEGFSSISNDSWMQGS